MTRSNIIYVGDFNLDRTLQQKVEEIRELDREIKSLSKQYDALKKEIIEEMGGFGEVKNDKGHTILKYFQSVSKVFDSKKFKEENADYYEMYRTKDEIRKYFRPT